MRIRLSIVLIAACGLVIWACGDNNGEARLGGTGGTGALSCDTLNEPPPGCDEPCSSDASCPSGTYCLDGSCFAQCTATEGCNDSATCNSRGRCVPNLGTGGTGGTGNVAGNACQSVRVTPSRSIPNVVFLVDESGSMDATFEGNLDRWEAAHEAIVGNPDAVPPVVGVVKPLESVVRFGLTTYHSIGGAAGGECPIFQTEVPIALDNHADIDAAYPASFQDIGVDTPTGESIDRLVSELQDDPPPADGPTIIVLATDGEPDTCATPNPQNGQEEAVTAATNAYAVDPGDPSDFRIETFILSVGEEVSDSHLQEMANVGIGLPRNTSGPDAAKFWKATDSNQLAQAFGEIIAASISCDIQMQERFVDPVKACAEGDVRLDGAQIPCVGPNGDGWLVKPDDDQVIQLVGTACDTLKSGDVEFSAEFPCGSVVVQ